MNWTVWLIIICVVGIILGNIMLVKHMANMKMPKSNKNNNADWDKEDE